MGKMIRYVLRELPGGYGYDTKVETEGLEPEEIRELRRDAPGFNYQIALLSKQTVLFVTQRYSDGHIIGRSKTPLRAVDRIGAEDMYKCLHAAAIEFLDSKKATFSPDITFEVLDHTRFAPGKRLEAQVPQ